MLGLVFCCSFSTGSFSSSIRVLHSLELQLFFPWPQETTMGCELFMLIYIFTKFPTVFHQYISEKKSGRKISGSCLPSGNLLHNILAFLIILYYSKRSCVCCFLQLLYLFVKRQVGLIQANLNSGK